MGFAAASAYKDPQDQCSSVRIFKGSDFSTTGSMDIHFSPTIRTTGYFFAMNPDLDIVSVGPTTFAIHSADESVDLETVADITRVIAGTLIALKK